jgi:LmbE family N-acetylglucosaminyl deacetylase
MGERPNVTIVAPHFDDAPLSLGQSMLDGALSAASVRVEVVFGRTNWTRWVHPTAGRARAISLWRRGEEALAQARFGYRAHAGPWEESILRTGELDPAVFRDAAAAAEGDPLVPALTDALRRIRGRGGLVVFPAGLGNHVDHRIVAAAGVALAREHDDHLAFYEDRPYVSFLEPGEREQQLGRLGLDLEPADVSGPVSDALHRWLRRCYPSQIDDTFVDAMARDRATGARERLWFPAGGVPAWLRSTSTG